MRKPARTAAALFGLGVGVAVGPSLGPAATWSGIVVAGLGVVLSLVGTTESDLVEDGLVDRDEVAAETGTGTPVVTDQLLLDLQRRPTLSGLGDRVEQILRLAERQAHDHRTEARREAEGVVTDARREAEAILNRAREQAAGITGTHREPPAAPPRHASAADEDPSRHA
ncbi:DivIVA domain-containing protein [Micromonospora sp. NPDC005203]|uniref:DivIVA domain-containing protein n=1 Tax=Micromonospora sp. NPDC005203 TaxID=3364226 RepID=UPI0036A2AD32